MRRNRRPPAVCGVLVSPSGARALDAEASAEWGLDPFALVEAAGRACANAFLFLINSHGGTEAQGVKSYYQLSHPPSCLRASVRTGREKNSFIVLAGSGNNAADALVMLRALILSGHVRQEDCAVYFTRMPGGEKSPLSQAALSVQRLGVAVLPWDAAKAAESLGEACVIIDGIAGTGLDGPLRGAALEMAEAVNSLHGRQDKFVVSIDVPSGCFDGWRPGMSAVAANATLAIEPQKLCLYTPAARPYAGDIIPVGSIFHPALIDKHGEAELVCWEKAAACIPPVAKDAYKYERGLVEIRAGSPGAAGAARLAAMGAQAAGAGLVRLIVDPSLYPVVAPACSGVMAVPGGEAADDSRFSPDAVLLGPGWGRGDDRRLMLEACLPMEARGVPLVLDADALYLAKDIVFHGNAILTPHPGEFAAYTGLPKEQILADPLPVLRRFTSEKNAVILLKSHVLYAASPDGRIGIINGMNPALGMGGTGDLLAGFCASIAARCKAIEARTARAVSPFDGYACACAAAALLVRTGERFAHKFADPSELAAAAASIAGNTWLPEKKGDCHHI